MGFLRGLKGTEVLLTCKTKNRILSYISFTMKHRVGPKPRRPPGAPWLLQTVYGQMKCYLETLA